MKKYLISLILDSDASMAQKMNQVLEPIFNKVYLQTKVTHFDIDCQGLKPSIVFVSLNIHQREESFAIIEKINKLEERPLIYGYLDNTSPELIAHAIEYGLQDVFIRPFESEVIATKISLHLNTEFARNKALQFFPIVPGLPVKVEISFKLMEIDENGFTLKSSNYVSKGTKFIFNNALVQTIFGKPFIPMMVTRTSQIEENDSIYTIYIEPKESSEANCAALRRFIMSKKE